MKKCIAKVAVASLTIGVLLNASMNVSAAKKTFKSEYLKVIKELKKPGEWTDGFDQFQLIYLNDDKVPELLAVNTPGDEYENNGTYQYKIYTFYDGKAKGIGEFSSGVASAGGYRGNTFYIKKGGKIYETYISSGTGEGSDIVYEMKKGKLKNQGMGDYSLATETYEWKDQSVSKETYSDELNKLFDVNKATSFEAVKTMSYSAMQEKLKKK